jgi:hypothetical protein
MCEAQCASLRSRLERRINRVPAIKRQMPLVELLAPVAPVSKPAPTKAAAATKSAATKKAPALAPATRKTRAAAPANNVISTTTKATVTKATVPVANAGPKHTAVRAKKRTSEEMSSEDKENAALEVPKKRVRGAVQKAPVPASKPAATTRTTRAASRQKVVPAAAILSPKNNNARQKPAKSTTTRPR